MQRRAKSLQCTAGRTGAETPLCCGRTELDHPELEFRYCSKCNGNYEYCQDHLFTHEHVKIETFG